jgi:4-hydroxybenzoate polyprenyltransferase
MSTAAPPRVDRAGSLPTAVRAIAADIKLAHSVFAMPFALLAAFMAAAGGHDQGRAIDWPRFAGQLALIVLAMVLARTVAMLANRLIDRDIDARNPRTQGRALPSGTLALSHALAAIAVCALAFMGVCFTFGWFYGNWWPTILGIPVLAWIASYGYFKRFTSLCHLWLGSSLALSPIAAAIAIAPGSIAEQPALWLISAMVLCWVAGFDIIYALQDVDIDRAQGLYSIPSRLGIPAALWISRLLHAAAAACLVAALIIDDRFGIIFAIGVAIVAALLIYEHATVARWGTTKIALAFFTLNGLISCLLGGLGIVDVILGS